ncbi:MAG: terminase small subunit [Candidatus Gastranaerophilales bacterium]|nr:terminase small subunit [Candidatus Gastranaerophilales bacterium]
MEKKLPKLTYKQQKFITRYIQNSNNASEAYRFAYDCSTMKANSITVEASKLLKNPNVTLWVEYYRENVQNIINEEIEYSVNDAFEELEELQTKSMESLKTYGVAMKAIENKCKLKGLFTDKVEVSGGATVQMGSIEVNGVPLELNIGDSPDDSESNTDTEELL